MVDPELPANTIPAWAATIIASVAEIKTRVERLPSIEREIDEIRTQQIPLNEHIAMQKRTDTLWDAYQRLRGVMWVMGIAQALLIAGIGGHMLHIVP